MQPAVDRDDSGAPSENRHVTERVCNFGANRSLLGISTEPGDDVRDADLPTVILLNAGLLHHVGQNRLNVLLARSLSRIGYPTLRFDFSGLGDSAVQQTALAVRERNVAEIREAMDFLQQARGGERFVLIGLCTGADNAHRCAVADERVDGIVMLDGYSYITLRYIVNRFRKKILRPSHWWNFLAHRFKNDNGHNDDESTTDSDARSFFWVLPKKSLAIREVSGLVGRGVRQLQVFSGSNIAYNYNGQYVDAMRKIDFGPLLHVIYSEQSDHTYSRLKDRNRLIGEISGWLQENFQGSRENRA